MAWSKLKQQLESFLCPALCDRVAYRATSYRYLPDKAGQCYLMVDKKNILQMNEGEAEIRWYQNEQEIKNDPNIDIPVKSEDIEAIKGSTKGPIPEERLAVIARSRKLSELAKQLWTAQGVLSKSDFQGVAGKFLAISIEEALESDDILLNVLALIDRRVGKKRLLKMKDVMKLKHPIVQYFYQLRLKTF